VADYPKTASDQRIRAEALLHITEAIFLACTMRAADSALLAESLVHADLRGVHSHGTIRIPDYVHKLHAGGVDPQGTPFVVSRKSAAIVVDGGNSMGQIGGALAMKEAIAAARNHGLALAALRGSNHCGALDWFTLQAAEQGMIGITGSNALPTMAPMGGVEKIIGMNPLSIALPAGKEPPLVMDLAFGMTAHGKIRVYHQNGQPIPEGWASTAEGEPTTDAAEALGGFILPAGGHKGIALAMMIGALSTLLSGAAYGTALGNMVDGPKPGLDGQFFLAIDIEAFRPLAAFGADLDAVIAEIHASKPRIPGVPLLVAGDMERQIEAEYRQNGIRLSAATVDDIISTARKLDVTINADLLTL
jgi:LDH2 family malate/lactate/ureidoglycolate dehydrogenase